MSHAFLALLVLAAVVAVAVLLVMKLFWPSRSASPDAGDEWAQRNDLRSPSLENGPEAGDTAVDAAVAVQDLGIH